MFLLQESLRPRGTQTSATAKTPLSPEDIQKYYTSQYFLCVLTWNLNITREQLQSVLEHNELIHSFARTEPNAASRNLPGPLMMAGNDSEGAFKESTEMEEQVRFEFSILTVHTILAEHPLVNETCHV